MIFSEEQLNNKDFLEKIKAKAENFMIADQTNEAYHLAKDLDASLEKIKDFKDKYFDLFAGYKKIIHRLKWLGLPIMTEDMAIDMFKYHFTEVFHIVNFSFDDLWRKLKIILLAIIIFKERDQFKQELRQALLGNNEKITSKKLTINNQAKAPTIMNWLLDYNSNLGTGVADNLKRIQYFTASKNVKDLSQEEKNMLKLLFDLYEKLKLSSLTLEGLEEEIPVDDDKMKGLIKGGVFEPYKDDKIVKTGRKLNKFITTPKAAEIRTDKVNVELAELKKLVLSYPPGSFERKAVEEEIENLNDKFPMTNDKSSSKFK